MHATHTRTGVHRTLTVNLPVVYPMACVNLERVSQKKARRGGPGLGGQPAMGEAGEWIRIVGAGTYLGSTLLARNTNVLALDVQTVHPPRVRRF